MMNVIKINNKFYKYESYWRKNKNSNEMDYYGELFPFPKERNFWQNKNIFSKKLFDTVIYLVKNNKFIKYSPKNYKDCLICNKKNITNKLLQINNIRWENGLQHYIDIHNIKPSDKFINVIFKYQINPPIFNKKKVKRIKGISIKKSGEIYLKLDRNQILIMDALMKHGSYKRYIDKNNRSIYRYSEHAGVLDFDMNGLEKIIVYGNTTRIDKNDDDIFLPGNLYDAFDYEYYFHTHPATPKPGGRAKLGILYEFPSLGDIFHFIDHYNQGDTQGSIIITPEGMYIIRKFKRNNKKIKINEDKFYKLLNNKFKQIQFDAIDFYNTNFTDYTFYSEIAQNTTYIGKINKLINKFELHIDYFPRIRDSKGRWIIDTVYVPVNPIETN